MKVKIYNKAYCFRNEAKKLEYVIFLFDSKAKNENDNKEMYIKYMKAYSDLYRIPERDRNDEGILKTLVIKDIPPPKTFPKFSNEKPFKLKWFDKWLYNPKINTIEWDGEWKYILENIGHKFDTVEESRLKSI